MRKIFDFTLKLFLFLSPLFLFKNYLASLSKGLFFIAGSLTLFLITLNMKPKREFKSAWLTVIALFFLFRCFLGGVFGPEEWFNFWYSMASFFYVLCGILLFKTVYCYAEDMKQYLKPILFVCILNTALVVLQLCGHDILWSNVNKFNSISGFFSLPQQLSQYSAISIPVLYFLNPFLCIFPAACLLLSREVSAIVSLFAGASFYLFHINQKRLLLVLAFIAIVFSFFNIEYIGRKGYTRPVMWEKTLSAVVKKPFLGWGYHSFNDVVLNNESKVGAIQNPGAFNDYLHTAQEFGIPIVLAFFFFLDGYLKRFKKICKKSHLLICLATSVFIGIINMGGQDLIRYASVSGTYIVLLALFCIKLEKESI